MQNIKVIDSVSHRIEEALIDKGLKPIDLSKRTGISKASISQYMSGRVEPKSDRIYLMSKALGVDPVWLMGLDVPMIKKEPQPQIADDSTKQKMIEQILNDEKMFLMFQSIMKLSHAQTELLCSYLQLLLSMSEKQEQHNTETP